MIWSGLYKDVGIKLHKVLFGNLDYQHDRKRYGGALKKIKKICDKDEGIKQLLQRIEDLKAELAK